MIEGSYRRPLRLDPNDVFHRCFNPSPSPPPFLAQTSIRRTRFHRTVLTNSLCSLIERENGTNGNRRPIRGKESTRCVSTTREAATLKVANSSKEAERQVSGKRIPFILGYLAKKTDTQYARFFLSLPLPLGHGNITLTTHSHIYTLVTHVLSTG